MSFPNKLAVVRPTLRKGIKNSQTGMEKKVKLNYF